MLIQRWSSESYVWMWTYIGPLRLKDDIITNRHSRMNVRAQGQLQMDFDLRHKQTFTVFIFCLCSGSFDSAWVIIDGLYSHFIFHWACNGVRISLSDALLAFYRPFWSPQPTYCSQACVSLKSMHIAMSKITKSGHAYAELMMFDTAVNSQPRGGGIQSPLWMFVCMYVDRLRLLCHW